MKSAHWIFLTDVWQKYAYTHTHYFRHEVVGATYNAQQMALAFTFDVCFDDDNKNCDIYIATRYDIFPFKNSFGIRAKREAQSCSI